MAEIKKGILGGFSGKVGTVVGANWRGTNILGTKLVYILAITWRCLIP